MELRRVLDGDDAVGFWNRFKQRIEQRRLARGCAPGKHDVVALAHDPLQATHQRSAALGSRFEHRPVLPTNKAIFRGRQHIERAVANVVVETDAAHGVFADRQHVAVDRHGESSGSDAQARITSYNVCYTKLLRNFFK